MSILCVPWLAAAAWSTPTITQVTGHVGRSRPVYAVAKLSLYPRMSGYQLAGLSSHEQAISYAGLPSHEQAALLSISQQCEDTLEQVRQCESDEQCLVEELNVLATWVRSLITSTAHKGGTAMKERLSAIKRQAGLQQMAKEKHQAADVLRWKLDLLEQQQARALKHVTQEQGSSLTLPQA